jgi:alpha-mannosidase
MASRVATTRFIIGALGFCLILFAGLNTSADDRDWGNLTNGDVYFFYCSHQDLGWEGSYHYCKNMRNQHMIEPVVGWAKNNSDYKYCIEYTRAAMDFQEYTQTTEGKETLWQDFVNLVKSGQIEVGGTYNCGYESLFSGEGLVRQTYLGRKWLRGLGCDTEVAWNVDPPIRSLQTAQIYKKAGIKYMMDSCYKKGFFKWKSPNVHDGSDDCSIIVYAQGHYGYPWGGFIRNAEGDPYPSDSKYYGVLYPYSYYWDFPDSNHPDPNSIDYVLDYAQLYWTRNDPGQWPNDADNTRPWAWQAWDNYYKDFNFSGSGSELTGILPFYYSTDMGMPRSYIASPDPDKPYHSTLLADWADKKTANDPSLHLVTGKEALDAVVAAAQDQGVSFREWQGELPNTWAYIHGPGHYQLITKMRSAQRLLPAAEMFTAFNNILEGSLSSYPESTFTEAWGKAIFPDHGMGGKGTWYSDYYPDVEGDNDVVDVAMWVRVKDAEKTADEHLADANTAIANRIRFTQTADEPVPIVVFNTLSWKRSDPVICTVTPGSSAWGIIDADGHGIARQVLDTSGDKKGIVFLAENVPSLGYKTYYIVHRDVSTSDTETGVTHTDTGYENDYYEIDLTSAGIQSIKDKDTGQTLLESKEYEIPYPNPKTLTPQDPKTLTPFELFTLHSAYDDNYLYYDAGTFPEVPPAGVDDTFVQGKGEASWAYNTDESGPVRDVYSFTRELNDTENWWATVTQKLIFYRKLKRIDCEITLTNWGKGVSNEDIKMREWRMALPLAFSDNKARVTYEVPMGTVLVGRDEVQDSLGSFYYYDAYDYAHSLTPTPPLRTRGL